jgi:hypothetical protein
MENQHTTKDRAQKKPGRTAQAILAELDRQGRTRYWLMKETSLDSPTVYGYLQGTLDCRVSTVERMTGALGMGYPCNVEPQRSVSEP